MTTRERGSLALQSIPVVLLVLLAGLGAVQVALTLYGANILRASAHEAARGAVELGSTMDEARRAAVVLVRRAAGGMVEDLEVDIAIEERDVDLIVTVQVHGRVGAIGPVPVSLPMTATSTASKEKVPL